MDIKLTSQGKEAHSSMPEKGYNAIDPLMDLLVKVNKAFRETDKNNPDLGKLTFNITVFTGGEQVNMIPGEATVQINVRTIPEFNNSLVEKKLTEFEQKMAAAMDYMKKQGFDPNKNPDDNNDKPNN